MKNSQYKSIYSLFSRTYKDHKMFSFKTTKKSSKIKDEFNKKLAKKIHERFSGIKTKNMGDGMMEISFK